jgi:hypothetical protein
MRICSWPDCDREVETANGHLVGQQPGLRVVQFCRSHESMWAQMVQEQRLDELYDLFEDERDGTGYPR